MIPAPYSDILGALCDDMGWSRASNGSPNLGSQEWHSAKRAVSRALGLLWPRAYWRDLLTTEQRFFAPDFSATETVSAGVFRYHRAALTYYLCLQDEPLTQPAELVDVEWEDITGAWTPAELSIAQPDDWHSTESYLVGDRVHATDGGYFQCIEAHTDQEPPNGTYWGQLAPLIPSVDKVQTGKNPIGRVEGVYPVDPRVFRGARRMPVVEEGDRINLRMLDQDFVWVRFMPPTPRLFGDIWSSTATYQPAATTTSQSSSTAMGNSLGYRGRDALRAETVHRDRQMAYLIYLVSEDDGQGCEAEFRSGSFTADDGVSVWKPDNIAADSPGRWHQTANQQ